MKNEYVDILNINTEPFRNNKAISLFTGAGGLDIGLEQAGFETVVCIDTDANCRETIKQNRPAWRLFENKEGHIEGDIRKITPKEILDFIGLKKGEAALVAGGAPCQPFSNIGKRNGRKDPDHGNLFLDFIKIVKGTQPKAFLFENVSGITQKLHDEVIRHMCDEFKKAGYAVSSSVLNSADFGVPQKRKRFFLLGIRKSTPPKFPLPTNYKSYKLWKAFIGNFKEKPRYRPKKWITIEKAFKSIPKKAFKREDCLVMKISDTVRQRMEYVGPGENFKVLPMHLRPNCWKNGAHQGQDTFGRLRLDEPSVTIRTSAYNPSKGKYIHPLENRGLNTTEMAKIQAFPHNWKFYCASGKLTLTSVSKQIGNAVPPPIAKALGLALKYQILNAL